MSRARSILLSRRKCLPQEVSTVSHEKGDDTRFDEKKHSCPAPKRMKGNVVVDLDPSNQKRVTAVPQNEPEIPHKDLHSEVVAENDNLAEGKSKQPDPDDVAHTHEDTKAPIPVVGGQFEAPPPSTGQQIPPSDSDRKLDQGDIIGATPTGYSPSDIGNAINPAKGVLNARNDTLRPMFGMANPMDSIPSTRDQMKSDLIFEDFSIVPPGFGLGVTNKMFLMEEAREKQIIYREPLAEPRTYQGPSGLVQAEPLQWQNSITKRDRGVEVRENEREMARMMLAVQQVGSGSTNVLGNDLGFGRASSDKGLNRPPESVFEPVIRKPLVMERVRLLTGQQLEGREMRRLFEPTRFPERFDVTTALEGGPIMTQGKALAMLPFPIGTA